MKNCREEIKKKIIFYWINWIIAPNCKKCVTLIYANQKYLFEKIELPGCCITVFNWFSTENTEISLQN